MISMSTAISQILAGRTPGIFWQLSRWQAAEGDTPNGQARLIEKLAALLSTIANPLVQEATIDAIGRKKKEYGIAPRALKQAMEVYADSVPKKADPERESQKKKIEGDGLDWEEMEEKGFCALEIPRKWGYYAMAQKGVQRLSNFTITPIFQVAGKGAESRHIFEVVTERRTSVVDVPSKALVELAVLSTELIAEKAIFFGSAGHLKLIANELLDDFPTCHEIKFPGWRMEGFYAFLNHIVLPDGSEIKPDKYGVFEFGGEHFLIPASSSVFSNMRHESDPYEHQRMLTWQAPKTTFKEWADTFVGVYGKKGIVGIAFALMAVFRDIVFRVNSNCPHLYCFGERSAGKSAMAESLCYLFYTGKRAYNLNTGTDFAFYHYMGAFRNALNHLNEMDDKTVPSRWFQSIKGAFDGEGRKRGKMGAPNQSEEQRVDSAIVLTGQYISTQDDNSLVTRSLIVPFHESEITDDTKAKMVELKRLQDTAGLNGLLPAIIKLRPKIREVYVETYAAILRAWRDDTTASFNLRIFQNWAHLSAMWRLAGNEGLELPQEWRDFDKYAYSQALHYSHFVRQSDALTLFWNTIENLLDQGQIVAGWHFRIEERTSVRIRSSDGKTESERDLGGMKRILYIRLKTVHPLYEQDYRRRTGDSAMTDKNVQHYISGRDYYIGQVKAVRFSRWVEQTSQGPNGGVTTHKVQEHLNTACYAFDYDALDCELDREDTANGGPAPAAADASGGQAPAVTVSSIEEKLPF